MTYRRHDCHTTYPGPRKHVGSTTRLHYKGVDFCFFLKQVPLSICNQNTALQYYRYARKDVETTGIIAPDK